MTKARTYTHDGKTMTLAQWADHLLVPQPTLNGRLNRGLPYEEVFAEGTLAHRNIITAFGETMTITEWGARTGLHPRVILSRMQRGETIEAALTRPRGQGKVVRSNDKRTDSEHMKAERKRKAEERAKLRADREERQRIKAERARRQAEEADRRQREKEEAARFQRADERRERRDTERARLVAKANAERTKAHASRGSISAESLALIEQAKANAKAKEEADRARAMAVQLEEPDVNSGAMQTPTKHLKKPVELAYAPVRDGLFGEFAAGAGGGAATFAFSHKTGGFPSVHDRL